MKAKITSITFIALLLFFFLFVVVLPKDERASEKENRPLAEMPEVSFENIFFGSFTTDFETYLTDKVGFRSYFVELGTKLDKLKGIEKDESEKVVTLASGGKLVLSNGKIMEVFKANKDAEREYISALNKLSEKLDCEKYIMLAPTQLEFDESEYRHYADSQKETIDNIYGGLKGFKTVNIYDSLKENKGDYIYFKTDHHWTQRGAYLAYEDLMAAKGDKATPLNDLKHEKLGGFLGYLYNQANEPTYSKYADDIEYFMGKENYTIQAKGPDAEGNIVSYQPKIYSIPDPSAPALYSIFMGGDHAFARIETNNKNGKTLLVIKDSYANALLPLLTENYEEILVIDPRSYYGKIDLLKAAYDIDELLVVNYVFSTTFTDYIGAINKIL